MNSTGKKSRNADRRRSTCWVRSRPGFGGAGGELDRFTLVAVAGNRSALSQSSRTMSASTWASALSDFAPEVECRSR
jgi:hypothetical protein